MHDDLVPTRKVAAHSIECVLRYGSVNYDAIQETKTLPFYQAYLLDVWLFVVLVTSIVFFFLFKLTSILYRVVRGVISRLFCVSKVKEN